jgi:hypothetical protein
MVKGRNENDVGKVNRSRQPGKHAPLAMPGQDGMGSSKFPSFARLYVRIPTTSDGCLRASEYRGDENVDFC